MLKPVILVCAFVCMHVFPAILGTPKGENQDFPTAQIVKILPAMQDTRFDPWVRKIPWRTEWLPTPVFLPGEPNGQRSLMGYSPWGRTESDTTEAA